MYLTRMLVILTLKVPYDSEFKDKSHLRIHLGYLNVWKQCIKNLGNALAMPAARSSTSFDWNDSTATCSKRTSYFLRIYNSMHAKIDNGKLQNRYPWVRTFENLHYRNQKARNSNERWCSRLVCSRNCSKCVPSPSLNTVHAPVFLLVDDDNHLLYYHVL